MNLQFDISKCYHSYLDIWVDLETIPFLLDCKFLKHTLSLTFIFWIAYFKALRATQNIVDNTYYTVRTALNWEEKRYAFFFVDGTKSLADTYNAGKKMMHHTCH